jgi:hypothetical protein
VKLLELRWSSELGLLEAGLLVLSCLPMTAAPAAPMRDPEPGLPMRVTSKPPTLRN